MAPPGPPARRSRRLAGRALAIVAVAIATVMHDAGPVPAAPNPAPGGEAVRQNPPDDIKRGLRYAGLRRPQAGSRCRNFEAALRSGDVVCTHGPDPAPEGVDVTQPAPVARASTVENGTTAGASTAAATTCQGDGTSGQRVQLVYARPGNVADRFTTVAPSIRQWAAAVDDVINASAAETGGSRRVRYVHDAACQPVVVSVQLSTTGDDTFSNTIDELRAQGYNRTDRKYMVWMDANVYCGIGQVYDDDRASSDNNNNGRTGIAGMVARIDSGCWGQSSGLVEAHELAHTLGSVQATAPNATANGHCNDESDRMCYPDGSGVTMRTVCASTHEHRLDCNHDDYFSTAPPAGSYLATHWNTANSAFLAASGPAPATTTTTTSTTTSTTTTVPPTTTTLPPPVSLQSPYSVWTQPSPVALDGTGTWIATANDPAAGAGQLAPSYIYSHVFGFTGSSATGTVALLTAPTGKFALFTVREASGRSYDAAVPFNWTANRFYYLFVYQVGPGVWGGWVYDHAPGTWVGIGQLNLPAAFGKVSPASFTSVGWFGPTATRCSAFPRADVLMYPAIGYVGNTPITGVLSSHGTSAGACAAQINIEHGIWARYRLGT